MKVVDNKLFCGVVVEWIDQLHTNYKLISFSSDVIGPLAICHIG